MILTYNTLSSDTLDTEQVSTVDNLINAVSEVVDSTVTLLANAQEQNNIYAYQVEDRNLALADIQTIINGGTPSAVNNKIDVVSALIQSTGISDEDRTLYTNQLAELNTYRSLISSVSDYSLNEEEIEALEAQATTLKTNVSNLQSENATQGERITALSSELESAQTISSQYKMIVDTANTLLGLNMKNTDSQEQVEAAIKNYINTAVSDYRTSVDTTSASYQAGYSAGAASADIDSAYNNGYTAGYSAGVSAGSSGSSDSSTIATLTSQITSLSNEKNLLQSENATLSSWVTALSAANSSLETEKQSLESQNNSLKSQNSSLQSQVTSLSRTQNTSSTSSGSSSSGNTASITPTSSSSSVGSSSSGSTSTSSGTTTSSSNKSSQNNATTTANTNNVPQSTNSTDTVIAGKATTTSGATTENGQTLRGPKYTKTQSEVPAEGQSASTKLTKLTDSSKVKFDLHGASYTDTTDEQKDTAYTVINYYLNHLESLGNLGSEDLKKIIDNDQYLVEADVIGSIDVTPSEEMITAFNEQEAVAQGSGTYNLNISSDGIKAGDLYFVVHESEAVQDTIDVVVETATEDGLNLEFKDLSPVTITKISYNKMTAGAGGETDTITSTAKSNNNGLKIAFLIGGILAVGGGAILFILYRKKRAGALIRR